LPVYRALCYTLFREALISYLLYLGTQLKGMIQKMSAVEFKKVPFDLETASREDLIQELRRMQALCEHLDQIIEYAPDGIYITDGDANAIRINLAFERISGLKRSDL